MNTKEQAPDSCPFCGAAMMGTRSTDGEYARYKCGNAFDVRNEFPRSYQSEACATAERIRLTRERDEEAAKADHLCVYSTSLETANRQLNKERDDILARVKRLATDGDRMDLLLRCESGIEDTEEWANATREMQLAMIAKAQRDWRKAKEAKP